MARDIDMLYADFLNKTGGDPDLMRRVEQFGPDILNQYGAQPEAPPMGLPAGQPMAQMPQMLPEQPARGTTSNDYLTPKRKLDVPQQAQYSGPAKGFSRVGVQSASAMEQPTRGAQSATAMEGAPNAMRASPAEMTAFQTADQPYMPTPPPSDGMLDAVIAAQMGQQAPQQGMSNEDAAAVGGVGAAATAGAVGYGAHRAISGKAGAPAKPPSAMNNLDLRPQQAPPAPMDPQAAMDADFGPVKQAPTPQDKWLNQQVEDSKGGDFARGANQLDPVGAPGDPVAMATDTFKAKLAEQGWAPDQIRRTVNEFTKVLQSGDEAAIGRMLTKVDPEVFDAFYGSAEGAAKAAPENPQLKKLMGARNMMKALRFK